jgi:hypothetical protein
MTGQDSRTLYNSINRIKNISYIMDILFQKINEEDGKETKNQKIEKIEKAYDYLKKYGAFTLKDSIQNIKEITDKIIVDSIT